MSEICLEEQMDLFITNDITNANSFKSVNQWIKDN